MKSQRRVLLVLFSPLTAALELFRQVSIGYKTEIHFHDKLLD